MLLDTNAVLWMLAGHARAAPLRAQPGRLYLSPVTLLELRFLVEVGRLVEAPGRSTSDVADDPRWTLDDPPSAAMFGAALDLSWTRDPFDRLLSAHARHRRWRLATGDRHLIERLGADAFPL